MQIKGTSYFKNHERSKEEFRAIVNRIELLTRRSYEEISIDTALGETIVYKVKGAENGMPLVIFPGFRTTALVWDLDKGLSKILESRDVYLIETNGQPNLSEGRSPDIKSDDYGIWAVEVLDALKLDKIYVAGASFGALVGLKLAKVAPDRIKKVFLLNPGCLRKINMNPSVLWKSIKPLIRNNKKNLSDFLDSIVFHAPNHTLSEEAYNILVDYERLAIDDYKDKTQKPYDMSKELKEINVPVYLVLGDRDVLFPHEKSVKNAEKYLDEDLLNVKWFEGVGHGIETHVQALEYLENEMKD